MHVIRIVLFVCAMMAFGVKADGQTRFQFPTDNYESSISFSFGAANPDYEFKLHTGEDIISSSKGMPVYASADGMVMIASAWKKCPNWGYILVIEHSLSDGSKICSVYGHLDASTI